MTLKPCTSAQLQRDIKIGNILDTTKNSSASCVFIIRLLKRFGEPGGHSTGVVNCHYFQNFCNPLYINKLPPWKSRIHIQPTSQLSASAIAVYLHLPSQYIFICHRSISSKAGATSCRQEMPFSIWNDDKRLCFLFTACSLHATGDRERLRPCHPICSEGRRARWPLQQVLQERPQAAGRSHAAIIRISFPAFIPYAPLEPFPCFSSLYFIWVACLPYIYRVSRDYI